MAYTDKIDTSLPAGTDDPAEADDNMRRIQAGFQEILDVEHDVGLTGTEITGDGKHTDITTDSITNAGALTNAGAVTNAAAVTNDATLVQTGIATLAVPPVFTKGIIANNAYLTARDAADGANINMIKLNATDKVTLNNGAAAAQRACLSSDDPPVADIDISNKKYVDDSVPDVSGYTANDAVGKTTIGDLQVKWGKVTCTGTSTAFTFAGLGLAAFTNYCFQVVVCQGNLTTDAINPSVDTISKTGATLRHGGNVTVMRFIAYGR